MALEAVPSTTLLVVNVLKVTVDNGPETSLPSMIAVVVENASPTVTLFLALNVVDSAEMIPPCGSRTGSHSNPSPTKPTRQVQRKLPRVLVHSAYTEHGDCLHSFTSDISQLFPP